MPRYNLIDSVDIEDFENEINSYLELGWRFFGDTKVISYIEDDVAIVRYYQPMLKIDELIN